MLLPRMWVRYDYGFAKEQLHDLMDAVENIPVFLYAYGGWFNEQNMHQNLVRYDEKWANPESQCGASLLATYDRAVSECSQSDFQRVRDWEA